MKSNQDDWSMPVELTHDPSTSKFYTDLTVPPDVQLDIVFFQDGKEARNDLYARKLKKIHAVSLFVFGFKSSSCFRGSF